MREDGISKSGDVGLHLCMEEDTTTLRFGSSDLGPACSPLKSLLSVRGGDGVYKDDLTGQPLPPELVAAGRAKELEYFN